MANPTGTTYLQANNLYSWTDGDIYQIQQTDQLEGAASGASFSGLGVVNQPHQLLLNKIQLTHKNQLVDEANIAALQVFQGLFTSKGNVNGYLTVGCQDVSKGQVQIILNWGTISLLGLPSSALQNGLFSFFFSAPFPNAIWFLLPFLQSNNAQVGTELALQGGIPLVMEAITPLNKTGPNLIATDLCNAHTGGTINVATTANDGQGLTGIGWLALGY